MMVAQTGVIRIQLEKRVRRAHHTVVGMAILQVNNRSIRRVQRKQKVHIHHRIPTKTITELVVAIRISIILDRLIMAPPIMVLDILTLNLVLPVASITMVLVTQATT
jgi:hypothetical protein